MTDDTDTDHAEQFRRASRHLMQLADAILATRPAGFDVHDVVSLFTGTAIRCLIASVGVAGAADYLRRAADELERETPAAH